MSPLNDKDLDRISRDAAEHYSVEPGATGWEQIEQRLNKELPLEKKKDRRRFFFWLFFIAVVSGTGLVWMLSGNNPDEPAMLTQQQAAVPSVVPDNSDQDVNSRDNTSTNTNEPVPAHPGQDNSSAIPDNKNTATGTVPVPPAADDKEETASRWPTGDKPATVKPLTSRRNTAPETQQPATTQQPDVEAPVAADKNAKAGKQQPVAQAQITPARQQKNKQIKDQPEDDNSNTAVNKKLNTRPSVTDNDKVKPVTPAKDQPDALASKDTEDKKNTGNPVKQATEPATALNNQATDSAAPDIATINTADSSGIIDTTALAAPQKPAKKKKKVERPLELGIITGPDFSNVKFKETYKTGLNIGLQVGYRLTNRWSFNTGFIYTYRSYMAMGEDFTPPKHTPMSYLDLDKVMSRTSMYEIPLNVRYDLSVRKQHRLYASTGLSTYIFGTESFDCYYKYNGVDTMRNWKYNEKWIHPFSVLNLSVGYEHALGNRFSIQAEPYLKLPLKGLGYGSAMLDSYGLYLTFKYKPKLR